jgi:hypothetical protein
MEDEAMTKLQCPVCGNVSYHSAPADINCGDCLMERLEIVRLVRVEATDCPSLTVPDLHNVVLLRRPQR